MLREFLWMIRYLIRSTLLQVRSAYRSIDAWRRFWRSYARYQASAPPEKKLNARYFFPCLGEDTKETVIDAVYFYQDSWAFERIFNNHPAWHVDVGSHHKYVSLLSKVVPVTMVDIRPLSVPLASLKFQEGSILALPFEDKSVPSVSSICVVEHIGLGRYGDPIDPEGSEKAIHELKRIVQPGGDLYISVPIDTENRIYFNAHRAFQEKYLLSLFAPFTVIDQKYIFNDQFMDRPDEGFGVGCYHFQAV
jgi:SAM-dependent methyltransferase